MNKNPFDPNMFKNLESIMKNFQTPTQNMFGLGKMKKYIFILAGLIFMSGFGIGVMIGLLF
jgi:hypothetical protein